MRLVETRLGRLERQAAVKVPERVGTAWLIRQSIWRSREIIAALPDKDLARIQKELKAELEAADASTATPS